MLGIQKLQKMSKSKATATTTATAAFFAPKATKAAAVRPLEEEYTLPQTEDPVISAFYAQLTDKERIAHAIAVTKLGTSYDVTRTHGFLKWKRKQTQ